MSRNPNRFKVPHNRDLTRSPSSFEECTFTDYHKHARQQAIEAGHFLNGHGALVRRGPLPAASIDIATHLGSSRVGRCLILKSVAIIDDVGASGPLSERNRILLRSLITMLSLLETPHAVTVTWRGDSPLNDVMIYSGIREGACIY